MRNKYLSLVALAAAAVATSCSGDNLATEQEQQPNGGQTVTLTASVGNNTRVGMGRTDGNKVAFHWHAGDQITVQTKSKTGATSYANTAFKIADGTPTGASTATFNGTVEAGYDVATYALYPYNVNHTFDTGGGISYSFPTSYKYETVESKIFGSSVSTNMPMLGTINDTKISFQHLGGLLVIRIDKMPSAKGSFSVTAGQQLSGHFTIDDLSGNPVIVTADASTFNGVTFSYSNATKGSAGVFYLPVATGSYTGLKIQLYDENNAAIGSAAEYGSLTVNRADIITIPVYQSADGASYGYDYEVNGHKFIDLCLPSGTLWAETNVGATKAADYGNYYAWGEVKTKSCYDSGSYDTSLSDKYKTDGGLTTLESSDDAANMIWGSFCRMPSKAEFAELFGDYTKRSTAKQTNSAGKEVDGLLITSKKNGKTIFLPLTGYYNKSTINYINNLGANHGWYWSNALCDGQDGNASSLYFNLSYNLNPRYVSGFNEYVNSDDSRYRGQPVRAVAKKFGGEMIADGSLPDMTTNDFKDGWK